MDHHAHHMHQSADVAATTVPSQDRNMIMPAADDHTGHDHGSDGGTDSSHSMMMMYVSNQAVFY